ncbi:MAG: hypothetical protein ACKVU4_05275 [Phycisphaerales bacterium]
MGEARNRGPAWRVGVLGASLLAAAAGAQAQLRIATWNVTDYMGTDGREPAYQLAAFGSYQGRRMAPDVLLAQEFHNAAAHGLFLNLLNTAAGSAGDWGTTPFVDGPDSDQVLFYRTSRVQVVNAVIASAGGSAPNHPRHVMRYDLRPIGYTGAGATIACYNSHMKSGNTAADRDRRLVEAQAIRLNTASLPAGWGFLIAADLNIYTSSETAYVHLLSTVPNPARFFDPIRTPGAWNDAVGFRYVHTQDPVLQMDDRFDQILLSASLLDGDGFDYVGSLTQPYSTTTWNDPNHSYRAWGNDGSSFNGPLTLAANAMVGSAIATAIRAAAGNQGHIPVFLDMRVPAEVGSPEFVDFGRVPQNSTATAPVEVVNAGDVALWSVAGVAGLNYELDATAGFGAPAGMFADAAGGGGNVHTLTMDTAQPGPKFGTLTITSDAPDEPARTVTLIGEVVAGCYPDCTGDAQLSVADFGCFQTKYVLGDLYADCNASGTLTVADFGCFQGRYVLGCP